MSFETDIHNKASSALREVIKGLADNVEVNAENIRIGIQGEEFSSPAIVCLVEGYEEQYIGSGIYRVEAIVRIMSNSNDDTEEIHNNRIAAICDRLQNDDIADQLTDAVNDFHVYQLVIGQGRRDIQESTWIFEQAVTIHCQPLDIS